ncbi:MAG: DUF3578 domain-containing protein [Chloroflexi bacterium]|nr:DUF3578 domain-containing protein [Chloroflexota bacterium]
MSLSNSLKEFSKAYQTEVDKHLSKDLKSYKLLVDAIPQQIEEFLKIKSFTNLSVKGSIGQGNTTYYPWIGVFDDRVSSGATNGFYVVYLISDDFKDIFLTLNQGSTTQEEDIQNKYERFVFSRIAGLEGFEKGKLPKNSLVKTQPYKSNSKGKLYEETNMFYKKYKISDLEDEKLTSDLEFILREYQKCAKSFEESNTNKVQSNREGNMPISEDKMFNVNRFEEIMESSGLKFSQSLFVRFVCLLCAKPFVILTGLSGSGKTKLAQAFSRWICAENKQICMIPVGADWTNREPLLGYPNALEPGKYIKPENGALDLLIEASKPENSNKPYFLILDEMNLSHVERYFADFLSAMESNEEIPLHPDSDIWKENGEWKEGIPDKIKLPGNLFVIGTVNIDETTYMFSPKVLDRAGVLEFRVTKEEMSDFLQNPVKPDLEKLTGQGAGMAADFVEKAVKKADVYDKAEALNGTLMKFFNELKKTDAEFGYRTASEIFRFASVVTMLLENDVEWSVEEITDAAIIQKLLPKVHGSRRKLEPVLKTLAALCLREDSTVNIEDVLKSEAGEPVNEDVVRFPISLEKITRMYKRVVQDGFTSFAEA